MVLFLGACSADGRREEAAEDRLVTAQFLISHGKYLRAVPSLATAVELNPNFVKAWILYGDVQRILSSMALMGNRKDVKQAMELHRMSELAYLKALDIDSGSSEAMYGMGLLFFEKAFFPENVIKAESRKRFRDLSLKNFLNAESAGMSSFEKKKNLDFYIGNLQVSRGDFKEGEVHLRRFKKAIEGSLTRLKTIRTSDASERDDLMAVIKKDEELLKNANALLDTLKKESGGK